jgi:histidinol-phosphate aminotransferase
VSVRIRPDLVTLPAYKAGQKLVARAGQRVYKLSSNESPHPPLASVVEAIARAAFEVNRYPDPMNSELTAMLSDKLDVPAECITFSTGSVALLGNLMQVLCTPSAESAAERDEVLYAWRSFEAYPIWAQIAGAKSVQVPLNQSQGHDLAAMAAAITERTRMILICTPNNPTGTCVSAADFDEFMRAVPAEVLVVVDEAYGEYVSADSALQGLDAFRKYPNVAVLRTFSKAYGLAGLRVGYVIAPVEVSDFLRRTALPFGVSSVAQAATKASLEAEPELLERVAETQRERERVVAALRSAGWQIEDMQANFIWLPFAQGPAEAQAACEAVGLAVRPFPEGLRITLGEPAANDLLIEALSS